MSGVVAFEGELNSIVREYLDFNEFDKTLAIFDTECTDKGKPVAPSDKKAKANQKLLKAQNEILTYFESGQGDEFFQMWADYLPEQIRNQDTVAQKLEFYLNIYFAIYPIKHGTGDGEEGMNRFKTYIETRGAQLSQTTEFLPFYALPFVPNPKMHPSYKELFSDKWIPDLRLRLERFLNLALQAQPQPRLFDLYKGGGGTRQIQVYEKQLLESEKKTANYTKRYNRVQKDYHSLISITADLVDSLEQTVSGNPVSPEYLQQICTRLFSNEVRQSVDVTRPGTAGELLRQSVMPPQGLPQKEMPSVQPTQTLDYNRIKSDLTTGTDRQKGLLLQALRWKLTKAPPSERDAALQSYIQNDLFGCAHGGTYKVKVLELLKSESEINRQYMARLLNAFASLCNGRSYLAQGADLMRALMDSLRTDDKDSLTRENVLGCLQKLSLRRHLQSIMIEDGVIHWLTMVLEDNDALSDYTLEYSVALLMNLCLRNSGKKKCAESPKQILKVLSDLLGHENQEIIPYVNGTLYSILAIPSIREEAKAMGMEEILRCFIKDDQPDMNRQIEFIIKQLNSNEELDEVESDDEDEDEDEEDADAMEADLDKQEVLRPQQGELVGDRLLNSYYVTAGSTSSRRRKENSTLQQEDMLRRPVTPAQMKGQNDNPVLYSQPKSSRPPTGQGRPSSRDNVNRPPTRSGSRNTPGSRPNTQENTPRPVSVEKDFEGSAVVGKVTGQNKKLAAATKENRSVMPSQKAMEKVGAGDLNEYSAAFSTRPKIPRTPAEGSRPTSRGSVGGGPLPRPEYSESLPTSRPGSGGRPSSNGGKKPASPAQRHKPSSRGKAK